MDNWHKGFMDLLAMEQAAYSLKFIEDKAYSGDIHM